MGQSVPLLSRLDMMIKVKPLVWLSHEQIKLLFVWILVYSDS